MLRVRRDERGTVVVLVALLLFVFMAMGAIVIDIGALYAERRELQNGADAAALAIAKDCAEDGVCPGDDGARQSIARRYANSNASDRNSAVDRVVLSESSRLVEVGTSTSRSGGVIIPYRFGHILTGQDGRTVRAEAVAAWGPPLLATIFPFAISDCQLRQHTANYTVFPPATSNQPGFMYRASSRIDADDPEPRCFASNRPDTNGDGALEGGFAWLQTRDAICSATLEVGEWVQESANSLIRAGNVPDDCIGVLDQIQDKFVLVPIFDDAVSIGTGSGRFHIVGFAAFKVTGYRFSSTYSYPAIHPCPPPGPETPNPTCIRGFWVKFPGVIPSPVGGPNFGVSAVSLVR